MGCFVSIRYLSIRLVALATSVFAFAFCLLCMKTSMSIYLGLTPLSSTFGTNILEFLHSF